MKRIISASILGAGVALASTYPFCVVFFLSGYLKDGRGELSLAIVGALAYSVFGTMAISPLSVIAGLITGLGTGLASNALKGRRGFVALTGFVIGALVGATLMVFLRSLRIPFGGMILNVLRAYSGAVAAVAAYWLEKVSPHESRIT